MPTTGPMDELLDERLQWRLVSDLRRDGRTTLKRPSKSFWAVVFWWLARPHPTARVGNVRDLDTIDSSFDWWRLFAARLVSGAGRCRR
jgi:hypothetical protein